MEGDSAESLELRGDESFGLLGVDTPTECEYFAQNGILPYVLAQLAA